ncbi:MAG: hypothetical protein M1820_009760, partial [Bogoriella megaspora]
STRPYNGGSNTTAAPPSYPSPPSFNPPAASTSVAGAISSGISNGNYSGTATPVPFVGAAMKQIVFTLSTAVTMALIIFAILA